MKLAQLLIDLKPSGDVYVTIPGLTRMLRVNKTSFVRALKEQIAAGRDTALDHRLMNPEGTGRYSQPRRYVVIVT